MRCHHTIAAALLVLSATACAQPPQTTDNGLPIVRDAQHPMSSTHWEVVQLPGEATPLAAIVDSTRAIMLSLGCGGGTSLLLGTDRGPDLKDPSINLAWDGVAAPGPLLEFFPSTSGWGFGTAAGDPGFEPMMTGLKQHQTLEVTISAAGRDPLRYRFALAQADKAIDHVLSVCGKKG